MKNRESEFTGNIGSIRAVEDTIRATGKYTEGIRTIYVKHPPQGSEFPSKLLHKDYEVYPYIDLKQRRKLFDAIGVAFDLLWGDTPCIDVKFVYDYRINKAKIIIKDGADAVKELARIIPDFSEALARAIVNGQNREIEVKS